MKKNQFFKSGLVLLMIFAAGLISCSKKNAKEEVTSDFPANIVSLSPAATEILYAVGAGNQIAAVSEYSDYPEEAKEKPVVGGFDGKTISIEKILSFNPDFVYLTAGVHDFLIETLDKYKIPYYVSKAASIEAVEKEILEIGLKTGHSAEAEAVSDRIKKTVDELKQSDRKIPVYYEVWNSPYMSAGKNSFINDIINCSGGENIFGNEDADYPIVSEETIIARQPELILIPKSSGVTSDDVKKRPGWESVPAVKNNLVIVVDDNIFSRPGPRILDALVQLSDIIKKIPEAK